MPRKIASTTRGVLEIDWPLFGELCRALALKVAREYDPELILGIAKAGVIPGVVIASILQRDFTSMVVTRKQDDSLPILVVGPPSTIKGRRILIVDETCDSGHTLRLALNEVKAVKPAEVRTAVSFKTGPYQPDFHSFETEKYIILPWDREVVVDGELATRPDYVPYLQNKR
ncbi:MAG: phosphoribosyltransferase [Gemmatimonadales bacterium]